MTKTRVSKTVLTYGVIAGILIVSVMFIGGYFMGASQDNYSAGEWIGYLSMFISLSTIFLGINASKKESQRESFSFLDGFKVGLMITLIASILYVAGWMFYSSQYAPDFMEKQTELQIEAKQAAGVSEEEIAAYAEEMEAWVERYKNPFFKAFITFTEIFPVGLLVSLIGALVFMSRNSQEQKENKRPVS